jgi:hypothetical protein
VHEPTRMRSIERLGQLTDQRHRTMGLERPIAAQQRAQVGSRSRDSARNRVRKRPSSASSGGEHFRATRRPSRRSSAR